MANNEVEILLAEDNPDDALLTRLALEEYRLANRIHVVRDGAEALDFLFATGAYAGRHPNDTPKAILLDLKLPKMSGLQVLERIKSDPRTKSIPVVVLSSSREDRDLARAYDLGANSYIVKPVDFEQFSEAVKQLGFYWLLLNQPRGLSELETEQAV